MGSDIVQVTVMAHISRHNSEQDVADDEAWEELRRRLELLCRETEFRRINPVPV